MDIGVLALIALAGAVLGAIIGFGIFLLTERRRPQAQPSPLEPTEAGLPTPRNYQRSAGFEYCVVRGMTQADNGTFGPINVMYYDADKRDPWSYHEHSEMTVGELSEFLADLVAQGWQLVATLPPERESEYIDRLYRRAQVSREDASSV
jgi:hypothetical protein